MPHAIVCRFVAVLLPALILAVPVHAAPTLTTLITFDGANGQSPMSGLVSDAAGNLFGTTTGGTNDAGTVFEIAKTPTGYANAPTTLVRFNTTNGSSPSADLIVDAAGNLFGTTLLGGMCVDISGFGTVFEIAKTAGGYASTPTTLVSFNGTNGATLEAGLLADSAGNLFGTTRDGGASDDGTVFEITKTVNGYASVPITLVSFSGSDGVQPYAGLIADAAGDLFGVSRTSFVYFGGTVFEIVKTSAGYASKPTTLVGFKGANGVAPEAGLISNVAGDLFGTTILGGAHGAGTVFKVAKIAGGYAKAATLLVSFNGLNGQGPMAGLLADTAGNLFGTTAMGGAHGAGTVFKIAKTLTGYAGLTTLINFNGANGANPHGPLIANAVGDLFGATTGGGANSDGTVFKLTGSGFQVGPAP